VTETAVSSSDFVQCNGTKLTRGIRRIERS
jgi:hypothetical protein